MRKQIPYLNKLFLILLVAAFAFSSFYVSANTASQEEREALEKELRELEDQIAEYEKDISKTEKEKQSLQNQIYILKKEVNKLDLQIYQSNVMIDDLGYQIDDTEVSIASTTAKIYESRDKLGGVLQAIYEQDQRSMIEVILAEDNISGFFDDLVALETLNSKTQDSLEEIKGLKKDLEAQRDSLDTEKGELESVVKMKELQKLDQEKKKETQNYYLSITESEYQAQVRAKEEVQAKAQEIRARIFELIGVREAPTFGEALEMAKSVEKITGVRSALLLAVLTQESNIGKNVGQCYLSDPNTGSGKIIKSGVAVNRVMKPTRDVQPFLTVTGELGRDPYATPVSCPMSFGYGGAMGPAQFIPSTWMMYRDQIKAITGKPGDPWDIKDAFLASALYLKSAGAAQQTYNAEWRSAMIYFAGSVNLKYRFYGDSVMALVAKYEQDIASIEQAG